MSEAPAVLSSWPLCRDCLCQGPRTPARRCVSCGSPRLLDHPERDALAIAHVDCDAFFAAVEKRDDPSLQDKPVIIGGGRRGVVATACYLARTYGIRSAMPMFKALKACPHAVVIPPNMEKYRAVGGEIRRMMQELTPLVEAVSIDEAFLDLSGTERLHGASHAVTLGRFQRRVERELGLTVSVGLSCNKFLAKVASDLDKPRGFSIIGRAEAAEFLAPKPVGIIPGIGSAAAARLARAGIHRIGDVQRSSRETLTAILGREAESLARLARGEDARAVSPGRPVKSLSAETTFETDLSRFEDLQPVLWQLCEKVASRLKRAGLAGRSVTLKLKDSDFRLATRTRSGLPPTQLAARLFAPAQSLLRAACDGSAYRLIGLGASDLCDGADADRGDLADDQVVRQARMEAAVDTIRHKFGAAAVKRGIVFGSRQR